MRLQKKYRLLYVSCNVLSISRYETSLLHWTIFLLKGSKRKAHYPESFRSSQPFRHNILNCLFNVILLEILTIVLHYKVNKGK